MPLGGVRSTSARGTTDAASRRTAAPAPTTAPLFVIGGGVKGGLYGAQPSLPSLDANGNLVRHVDYRQVYIP
jgi:uncharacterized protein (DUF1501 family)